jgi:hypothetical protein
MEKMWGKETRKEEEKGGKIGRKERNDSLKKRENDRT